VGDNVVDLYAIGVPREPKRLCTTSRSRHWFL